MISIHDALTVLYANHVCDTCSFCDIFDVPDVRDVCEVPFALDVHHDHAFHETNSKFPHVL
jgi:hypothetical protein